MSARRIIAEAVAQWQGSPAGTQPDDIILAALEAEGYTVARLELVPWSDAYMMGMAATMWLDEDETPPPPSLLRPTPDPVETTEDEK